eukprot:8860243-Ditylum_brightwellii.AAC.1
MDMTYTLVNDLLKDNAQTAFNNKQPTFKILIVDNLNKCMDAVVVYIFPNKAYKLQKRYIWLMSHKLRHTSACKLIARVIKLNNYLSEFPTPPIVVPRNMEMEEILEVLKNRVPTS